MSFLLKLLQRLNSIWKNQHYSAKMLSLFALYLIARYIIIKLDRKHKQLPPGSVGYPLVGSFFSVASMGHQYYIDIAREKGKICIIPMGTTPIICINDVKLMKYILEKDCALWRPKNIFYKTAIAEAPMSAHYGGADWRKRRRFFQTNLMTMMNNTFVDENIKILIHKSLIPKLNELSANNNVWNDIFGDLQYVSFNIAYNCLFGGYLEKTDYSYCEYMNNFAVWLHELQLNVLRYLFFGEKLSTFITTQLTGNKLDHLFAKQLAITKKWALNAHKKYNKNNINTYYDRVYHQLSSEIAENNNVSYSDIITDKVIADFENPIEGSSDTVAATLEFCIVAAAKYPIIQQEIYQEIMDNIDDIKAFDLFPKLYQFHKLRAFVFETFRMIPVVPNSVFRQIRKVNGLKVAVDDKEYILPNNCIIIANIIGMQMNPKLWENPDKFDINRWLNNKGKFKQKQNPFIMNFTHGPRDCPGKPLALKSLYLIIAILFSKYKFYYDAPEKVKIGLKLDFVLHVHPHIGCKFTLAQSPQTFDAIFSFVHNPYLIP